MLPILKSTIRSMPAKAIKETFGQKRKSNEETIETNFKLDSSLD